MTTDARADLHEDEERRFPRRLLLAGAILALLVLAYAMWPLASAVSLLAKARAGDSAAIEAAVDLPRVRRSVARQIVASALRSGQLREQERQIVSIGGTATAAAWLEDIITPKLLSDLVAGRSVDIAAAPERPAFTIPPIDAAAGSIFGIWRNSGFTGLTSYQLRLNASEDSPAIGMDLDGAAWRITHLTLPPKVLTEFNARIAEAARAGR